MSKRSKHRTSLFHILFLELILKLCVLKHFITIFFTSTLQYSVFRNILPKDLSLYSQIGVRAVAVSNKCLWHFFVAFQQYVKEYFFIFNMPTSFRNVFLFLRMLTVLLNATFFSLVLIVSALVITESMWQANIGFYAKDIYIIGLWLQELLLLLTSRKYFLMLHLIFPSIASYDSTQAESFSGFVLFCQEDLSG